MKGKETTVRHNFLTDFVQRNAALSQHNVAQTRTSNCDVTALMVSTRVLKLRKGEAEKGNHCSFDYGFLVAMKIIISGNVLRVKRT